MIDLIKGAVELQQIGFNGLLLIIITVLIRELKNQKSLRDKQEKEKDNLHDAYDEKLAECNRKLLRLARGKEIEE
jgi:hypothetical protein